jgi:hypothetical protein
METLKNNAYEHIESDPEEHSLVWTLGALSSNHPFGTSR